MTTRSRSLAAISAVALAVVAGCSTADPATPAATTAAAGSGSALCELLTAQDFRDVAGLTPGSVQGGGSDTSATCLYGEHLELVVQIAPTIAEATAVYAATLQTGWFAGNVKANPVAGVDTSSYGTGPDAAAIALRRQRLVLTVTVPGNDGETALIQLAGRALAKASSLGT